MAGRHSPRLCSQRCEGLFVRTHILDGEHTRLDPAARAARAAQAAIAARLGDQEAAPRQPLEALTDLLAIDGIAELLAQPGLTIGMTQLILTAAGALGELDKLQPPFAEGPANLRCRAARPAP